jgi:hypothetical protein
MITSGNERKSEIADMYRNLQELFDARNLTEEERTVIKVLILFPLSGTKRNLFLKLVGFEYTVALSELEQTGWVEFNETNEVIFLHPVIKDIIDERFNITIEDKDIKRYTSNFMLNIRDCYNHNYQENNQYRELALSYIHYFPNPMISNYKNYLLISKLLWVLNMFDESIEIQNKIQTLFIDKEGKHANSAEEAEAMLQLGFINHGNGKYSEAAENLKLAARVFGNKYAAALSHQAQAMAFDNAGIEEIEPLLEQSLSIREKYWPNTISEAASCHLYAKMLSKYDSNLEKAISLEKRALSIFKRIDQEADANHKQGANISSAKYILGWLYVQQASDNDDLEDGIELLEEAKEQRLKDRGDVLHFWMEDIYLKLAQAYEKAEKYSEAEDYYNLLIKLQNKKYKENLSDKNILSTYRMLMELYDKMGKNAEAKKCRRLIRKYELV